MSESHHNRAIKMAERAVSQLRLAITQDMIHDDEPMLTKRKQQEEFLTLWEIILVALVNPSEAASLEKYATVVSAASVKQMRDRRHIEKLQSVIKRQQKMIQDIKNAQIPRSDDDTRGI